MLRSRSLFALFKYTLYALLVIDCGWFMREDLLAARQLLVDGFAWRTFGATLAQTLDTWAWLGLLLLFELETALLSPTALTARRRLRLHLARAFCYLFVLYACYGYVLKLGLFLSATPLAAELSLCDFVDGRAAYVRGLDDYVMIDEANCTTLARTADVSRLRDAELFADRAGLSAARWLALTDVVNAVAWILVAVVLEIEVWMQLVLHRRHWLHGLPLAAKLGLYATLAGAAVYWGLHGTFLDFWDAALWIVAFVFIEINVFKWGEPPATTATAA